MRDEMKKKVLAFVADSTIRWTLPELKRVLNRTFPAKKSGSKR